MTTPVDKLYEQYYNQGLDELNKQKNTLRNTAESDKNIINTNADASVQNITDSYNTQIDDTKDSYEDAFRNNEVQVKLNERYLERKAAEMGLTDSGMNRTQMTANQLSYANQKGELTTQRQKAVDTLAAAMRAKISEVNINRNNKIAQVESTLNNNLAQMDSDYSASVSKRATEIYNKAQEVSNANSTSKTYQYDSFGNVTNEIDKDERKKALSDLNSAFDAKAVSDPDVAAKMIYDFGMTYDLSDAEKFTLIKKAGLTEGEFATYISNGSVYMSASDYNMAKRKNQSYGRVAKWNYKNDGALRYYFKITKVTNNWGGGVDNNDEVTIYYPDGTLVAENVRIDKLPEGIQQDITDRTAGKKVSNKKYDFYYTADLVGSTF